MLTITLDQLIDLRACKSAKNLFFTEFGDRIEIPEYTPQHQEYLVRSEWRQYLGWAWSQRVLPQWSMRGIDLRGVKLCGCSLRGVDLREANLSVADLRWAVLIEANLRGADLGGTNLRWANLCGANLRWANLCGANLHEANLHDANLRWARLTEANLGEANLRGADLQGALAESSLPGWDLVNGRLQRAEMP